jgi:DNA-binding NarL/FixJ family response regulator
MQTIKKIDRLTNWLLVAIVAIPFVLSASALNDLAAQHGQRPSWLYPVMVDGGLIIFKLLVLRAALRGQRDGYAWTMAVTATVISVGLNVHHAAPDWTARLMSALPPLAILAAFVAVTRRIEETAVEEGLSAQRGSLAAEIERLAADLAAKRREFDQALAEMRDGYDREAARLARQVDALSGQVADLKRQKVEAGQAVPRVLPAKETAVIGQADGQAENGLTDRQRQILAMMRQGVAQADIATKLGVSDRTVRRDVSSMNGIVKEMV